MAEVMTTEQARAAIREATIAEVLDVADRHSSRPDSSDRTPMVRFEELFGCLSDLITSQVAEIRFENDGGVDVDGELTKLAGLALAWVEDRRAG